VKLFSTLALSVAISQQTRTPLLILATPLSAVRRLLDVTEVTIRRGRPHKGDYLSLPGKRPGKQQWLELL
jgi:hypothetical protein